MIYTHRTLIITAAIAAQARGFAAALGGPAGTGMWERGLSPTGELPATHYITSGMIGADFAAILTSPSVLYAACQAASISITLATCTALLANSTVSDGTTTVLIDAAPTLISEGPHELIARLDLKLI